MKSQSTTLRDFSRGYRAVYFLLLHSLYLCSLIHSTSPIIWPLQALLLSLQHKNTNINGLRLRIDWPLIYLFGTVPAESGSLLDLENLQSSIERQHRRPEAATSEYYGAKAAKRTTKGSPHWALNGRVNFRNIWNDMGRIQSLLL